MNEAKFPMVLVILDGWGYSENPEHNAILTANTPNWDRLWQQHPHRLIEGSGNYVGLPDGQMGNSEVGHLNLGAGRLVQQDFTRISSEIANQEFFANQTLCAAIDATIEQQKAVHIMGLLSPGGVHSHEEQIFAALRLAVQRGAKQVYIHAFLDGRDTPPKSAQASIEKLNALCAELGVGKIVSLIGRYYAMDRDQRWDRVQTAYELLTTAKATAVADDPISALEQAYARDETDEFVSATSIQTNSPITIQDGDSVIFMNYRADRAREITRAFTDIDFAGFERSVIPKLSSFVCLTEYAHDIQAQVAYPPLELKNVLGEFVAEQGLKQLRIAETEKYAHVTFFFNGGVEQPFKNEERVLIPSPGVATYDQQPEMSAYDLTDELVARIKSNEYALIICNFANPDMVGHTGNFSATVKAIETVDTCIGEIAEAIQATNGQLLITADHGNAEMMYDSKTKQPHTAHTSEPVPLLYIGKPAKFTQTQAALSDLAPTMLELMGLTPPNEMTGRNLLKLL